MCIRDSNRPPSLVMVACALALSLSMCFFSLACSCLGVGYGKWVLQVSSRASASWVGGWCFGSCWKLFLCCCTRRARPPASKRVYGLAFGFMMRFEGLVWNGFGLLIYA